MKAKLSLLFFALSVFPACKSVHQQEEVFPPPETWGPAFYLIDGILQHGTARFHAAAGEDGLVQYLPDPLLEGQSIRNNETIKQ